MKNIRWTLNPKDDSSRCPEYIIYIACWHLPWANNTWATACAWTLLSCRTQSSWLVPTWLPWSWKTNKKKNEFITPCNQTSPVPAWVEALVLQIWTLFGNSKRTLGRVTKCGVGVDSEKKIQQPLGKWWYKNGVFGLFWGVAKMRPQHASRLPDA